MISKKSYIKRIILVIMIMVLFLNFSIISYAEETNINQAQISDVSLEINMEYIYNPENNTVTAIMHSNKELKHTKPSWTLSEDKLSYTKTFGANDVYDTQVEDINGNITTVSIKITQIAPTITVEYIKNSNNTVTAIMHSNEALKDTKPSWTLSADKLTYTKTFGANEDYTTQVEDLYGNITTVRITINQINNQKPFTVTIEYKENENNTVTAIIHSNQELKHTKPSWTLSEDKLSYTKTFGANEDYTTQVEDIYGNITTVRITINQINNQNPFTITIEYKKNDNNTVTVTMHSNQLLKDTKPSWTLSADKLSYTKTFGANDVYDTQVEDINGNVITASIKVTQIAPTITVEYIKNSNNTVTAIMHSNEALKDTKPSWTLSADKLSYTKTFGAKEDYTTQVEDIYGNITTVSIKITQIAPTITVEYIRNSDNTVTAILHSNEPLKDTKPSWTLSEDKLRYTKTFGANENYSFQVEDLYGNKTEVTITICISNFSALDESKYPGYKTLLQKLQAQHPNWILTIKYTGLDWNTVIDNENQIVYGSPRSLTDYSGQWRNGDTQYGTGWYRASTAAIAYMMDPRNSLDEGYVFQFQDLTSSAGTYSDIEKMLAGTFLTKYTSYSTDSIINTILSSSKSYNVSPYHLVSRMIQEQGKDGGTLNGYTYNGVKVYNLFNIGATGNTDEDIINNGAQYAYNNKWFTPEICIEGSTRFLNSGYLSKGQSTLYFQKYNVVSSPFYNNQYMQNIRAANDEGKRISDSYKNNGLLNCQFEFVIPVYENMPATACPRPAT